MMMMNEELLLNLPVTVEALARHANVLEGDDLDLLEETRTRTLKRQLTVLRHKPRAQQDKIYHEFAAKYLPRLVGRYKDNTGAYNSSMTMLNAISHTPYFARFTRLPAANGLVNLLAKRMIQVEITDIDDVDIIGEICQLLSSLLVLQGAGNVDEADKKALIPKLKNWQRVFRGSFASTASDRCIAILTDNPQMSGMVQAMKEMLEASITKCGIPDCNARLQSDGPSLMLCGKCKNALYCSPAHQKEAWPKHKSICYTPSF